MDPFFKFLSENPALAWVLVLVVILLFIAILAWIPTLGKRLNTMTV